MGFTEPIRIAVSPEVEKGILAIDHFPYIVVVSFAILRQLLCLFPSLPLVSALPHDHLSPSTPSLRTIRGRPDHRPLVVLDKKASCIIILFRLGNLVMFPFGTIVVSDKPFSRSAYRARLVTGSGKITGNGTALLIKIHILYIHVLPMTKELFHQGR